MERMGCRLSRPTPETIQCQGRLKPGSYHIPGNISSQYISGLLLSLIHADGDSEICISGTLESRPYVDLTFYTLDQFNTTVTAERIPGNQRLHSPGILPIEGDWSNAAFFLAASSLGSDIAVKGLPHTSFQGDQAIQSLLPCFRETPQISAANIPDLIPILSAVAAANRGAIFTDIQRLRTKESDRVEAIIQMLRSLGGNGEIADNTLTIFGTGLTGGMVDSCNDHRIAMSAAIAATVCTKPVTILGAQCVRKSYPLFWEEYSHLGGHYEQYIR
jgi:3-phosphoshikimate 1-carboxyvinyltransferase